jgi:hypothetical protein
MRFETTHSRGLLAKRRQTLPPEPVRRARGEAATTFIDILISIVIVALVFGTIINGYLAGAVKMEWTGYSLAAQSLSAQSVEQARSAVWDIAVGKNQLTNMINGNNVVQSMSSYDSTTLTATIVATNLLDVPWRGTNYTTATNIITIQQVNESGVAGTVLLQFIRVDTIWPFSGWGNHALRFYTNTTCTYMAPDNRDPSTLGD